MRELSVIIFILFAVWLMAVREKETTVNGHRFIRIGKTWVHDPNCIHPDCKPKSAQSADTK